MMMPAIVEAEDTPNGSTPSRETPRGSGNS